MQWRKAEQMRPEPEQAMIARPSDITRPDASGSGLPRAETPLQRQIILWQRELLRQAEARHQAASRPEVLELPGTESQMESEE